jgi:hypothetical protein
MLLAAGDCPLPRFFWQWVGFQFGDLQGKWNQFRMARDSPAICQ